MPKSSLSVLLDRLERWRTPDGFDVEPRRIAPAFIRFSGKLSLSAKKMERGRRRCEARLAGWSEDSFSAEVTRGGA